MAKRVNALLEGEVEAFGNPSFSECFNCGNCTAVCPLSEDETLFPRKTIRQLQLGLRDDLKGALEPWLCYYCGTCSETCPRNAEPGELMMATRRWLTAQYDWTGLSKLLYLSKAAEVAALLLVGGLVVALFALSGAFTSARMPLDHVRLNTFAPVMWVHYGDWVLAGLLSFFLLTNALRMHRFVMSGVSRPIPLTLYIQKFFLFVSHALTQTRWRQCEDRTRWFKHFLLVTGYATMLILVVAFLPWFQRDGAEFHWTSLLGYYATAILLWYTVDAMIGRARKSESMYRISHHTDWMFLILLFLVSLTGILVHIFRLFDLPMPTYITYVVHLALAVPMLIVEVPFGKWAHLLYRPFAAYLQAVKEAAEEAAPEAAGVLVGSSAGR